jgi:hypothetical protein
MSDSATQTYTKCAKELSISEFKPLSTGKGHYKKCNGCTPAKTDKPKTEKKPKAEKKAKKEDETLVLLSNFESAYNNLRAAYTEKNAVKANECFVELSGINAKLNALCI